MRIKYILNTTDKSFDYGDFPGSTHYDIYDNGFILDINNYIINISSLELFGDCEELMEDVKTLNDLKRFLTEYFEEIENEYKRSIKDLIYFIDRNLKMEV